MFGDFDALFDIVYKLIKSTDISLKKSDIVFKIYPQKLYRKQI